MKEYFGFVYIWYDTKYKKFLIGSHHGKTDDSYTTATGGIHVRNIFKSRPDTMKRRILEYNTSKNDRKYTLELEQKWIDMRPDIKNNKRYYNKTNFAGGGFDKEIQIQRVLNGTHHFLGGKIQKNVNARRIKAGTHNFLDKNHKKNSRKYATKRIKNNTHHFLRSDFNKKAFILYCNDIEIGKFNSKVEAVKHGVPAHIIDKARKYTKFTIELSSRKNTKIKFNKNDVIYYQPENMKC